MINDFPSFQSNFEAGKRRLRKLKKIATNKTGTLDTQDAFLFILVGNINIRLNTIAFLMANLRWCFCSSKNNF